MEIIDSPSVREFNLWLINKQAVLYGFKELRDYLGKCRFRDCQHLAEPDYTVKTAVKEGKISAKRYKNYQKMMDK